MEKGDRIYRIPHLAILSIQNPSNRDDRTDINTVRGESKDNCWGCRFPNLPTKNKNTIIYHRSLKQYEQ